ncbi:MAG: ribonuclease D, partial [Rhodobacteraceae bacterium]|nr:ribonuclease D [Paracoccaceae bacterium]
MTAPILTTTAALEAFCDRAARAAFITLDTEFVREKTYRPVLCLLQMALPTGTEPDAVLVDPLAGDIDLKSPPALARGRGLPDYGHAGGQDIE